MRIRSIKPEFWRSSAIASLTIEDRLLFIGLWSYVDDSGAGIDRLAIIAADLFADDLAREPRETFARVSRGILNLAEAALITRYTVQGHDYLAITNWKEHQRIDKPGKPRYPDPTSPDAVIRGALPRVSRECRESVAPGAGEQGNRGTGEQSSLSVIADAPTTKKRDDVDGLVNHLAARIVENGNKPPNTGKLWHDQARLLIDRDQRTLAEAHRLIDWCQADSFWAPNIMSMAKFREKYDQLRLKSQRSSGPGTGWDAAMAAAAADDERMQA